MAGSQQGARYGSSLQDWPLPRVLLRLRGEGTTGLPGPAACEKLPAGAIEGKSRAMAEAFCDHAARNEVTAIAGRTE